MEFTQEELKAIRAEYCKNASDTQFELFISECKARNLRPGTHLVFQLRAAKEYDSTVGAYVKTQKPYWITTIGALRLIALRTGQYGGPRAPQYIYLDDEASPSVVSDVPLPSKADRGLPREPWAVRVEVKRKDFTEPVTSVVRFDSVAGTRINDGKLVLTEMWSKRGPEQNAKCSEADALRKAFPEEMGSLYIAEELKNEVEEAPQQPVVLAPAPTAPVVPQVNQIPAEPTNEPRPGEEKLPTLVEIVLNKPADETPVAALVKAKTTRKKAEPKIPDNGKDIGELGITDEDIALAHKPVQGESPEEIEQRKREGQEFAEDVGSAVPTPDRLPTKEQSDAYVSRIREMVKTHGVSNSVIGTFVLGLANKKASKELTVGDWDKAFEKLDMAAEAGTLKELVK